MSSMNIQSNANLIKSPLNQYFFPKIQNFEKFYSFYMLNIAIFSQTWYIFKYLFQVVVNQPLDKNGIWLYSGYSK